MGDCCLLLLLSPLFLLLFSSSSLPMLSLLQRRREARFFFFKKKNQLFSERKRREGKRSQAKRTTVWILPFFSCSTTSPVIPIRHSLPLSQAPGQTKIPLEVLNFILFYFEISPLPGSSKFPTL